MKTDTARSTPLFRRRWRATDIPEVALGFIPLVALIWLLPTLDLPSLFGLSGWLVAVIVMLFILSLLWLLHFLAGSPAHRAAKRTVIIAVSWFLLQTDWIVKTDYEYMGRSELRTHIPPVSPIFLPPSPADEGQKSWRSAPFFYGGGTGAPSGEPWLTIHWRMVLVKATAISVTLYLVLFHLGNLLRTRRT